MNNPTIQADQLTAGDLIRHRGELLKAYSEPVYTNRGIEFDALPLDVTDRDTQAMCFQPKEAIEHVGYQLPFDYNQPLTA